MAGRRLCFFAILPLFVLSMRTDLDTMEKEDLDANIGVSAKTDNGMNTSWKESHSLSNDQAVVVHTPFQSNDKNDPIMLTRGLRGVVERIDSEGDAQVEFDGKGVKWVLKRNFPNLAKLFKKGDRIVIQKTFESANKNRKATLKKGDLGTIDHVDEEGDANVEFDKHGKQWVLASENFKVAKVRTSYEGFGLNAKDINCIACIGFWSTYDPRPEYNLKSTQAVLEKCSSCNSRGDSVLTNKDIQCIVCTQFWSTYDARPEFNLKTVSGVLSECPDDCPH